MGQTALFTQEGEAAELLRRDGRGTEKKTVYPFTPGEITTIIEDKFFAVLRRPGAIGMYFEKL